MSTPTDSQPRAGAKNERRGMLKTRAYAAASAKAPLAPHTIERRMPGAHDVRIEILYCGVCHSDIHQARDEWGGAIFPMVPGHEIIGTVKQAGDRVTRWKAGDLVGVGCFVDSCRECEACRAGEEQYCENEMRQTYNSLERDGKTPTYGGYSTQITVDENYLLRIPESLNPERAAPLLCAGITTYSPLRHFNIGADDSIAVLGLGGLGHVGVRIAKAMGAKVAVLSHSASKRADALRLGADEFLASGEERVFQANKGRFKFILDTVSARHDYNDYLELLRRDGTLVLVGLPEPTALDAGKLIVGRKRIVGSLIGGIRQTQEMLDFCAGHGVVADVEMIPMQRINDAYDRIVAGDVRYRFVIDMDSLKQPQGSAGE